MSRKRIKNNNSNEPLVSVIVPNYNRLEFLPIAINSLVNQTYGNIEIIVINDGGQSCKEIIDSFQDDRIKYFEHDKNMGLSAARNTGLKNSNGKYISFLDSDDFYLPLAIEFRIGQLLKRNAEIVYTRALQNILEPLDTGGYRLSHQQLYWDSPFDRDLILIQNISPCCCPMFSRKSWDDSGNYFLDENLDTSEDQDFWNALSRKNDFIELKLVDCECTYRTNKTQMTGTRNFAKNWPIIYKRWRHTAKNMKWVVENQNAILKSVGINPSDHGL